jgi:S-adenosylmethionine:tRNA ribosyltransferase-isomerase
MPPLDGPGEDPRLAPYHYDLPPDRIARHPPPERDGGRLLHLGPGGVGDHSVRDLPGLLAPGDLLVVNDTRVLHARLQARRATGGRVEVLLLGGKGARVAAMVRPARRLKIGESLTLTTPSGDPIPGMSITLLAREAGGVWTVSPHPDAASVMAAAGVVPLPPYLGRAAEPADAVRYQTVFAGPSGAVAAPTAGLHLSAAVLAALAARGVTVARVTLHVGAGTFRNLRPEDLDAGKLHAEWCQVSEATAAAIRQTRAAGGRVVAVGTTATRTLESRCDGRGGVRAGEGTTDIFIRPGYRFEVVDALLTNLHLPGSSLLMLTCAFGGRPAVMSAYRHAVSEGYRFFSYGDAMLLTARHSPTG